MIVWDWMIGAALASLHGRRDSQPHQHDTVRLSARIEFQLDDGSTHVHEFVSPGQLWDGSVHEHDRIEAEERAKLAEMLEALGMDPEYIK